MIHTHQDESRPEITLCMYEGEYQPAHIRGEALWLVVFSLSAAALMLLGARDVGMWALNLIIPLLR